MYTAHDVSHLVEEYRDLFEGADTETPDALKHVLTREAEWTGEAAEHLLRLATAYGSFMLRNALAIALVLHYSSSEG
jgi:predicted thioredoxin/glutaredoxin